ASFPGAVQNYSKIANISPDDSQVYVDLAYAYENNGEVEKALENYMKAIAVSHEQYATPYLRAAIVYHRKQDTNRAIENFNKAEALYSAASDSEGVNEVLRRRGILFRDKGRYAEARQQFEKSLEAARTLGNDAQQINALLELSYLLSMQGNTVEAEKFAQQAVNVAQEKQLENLLTAGLLQLGNSFSGRGDYKKAEEYFSNAIKYARENKGKLSEARGLANLGGLYIQTARVDEGLRMVQEALAFFQQNNYVRNLSYCLTQIARAHRRKGDYNAALQTLNQRLQIAQQGGSQIEIANNYAEIGAVLIDQENFPAALEQYDKALAIYKNGGNQLRTLFSQANRANILWRLGRYDEAKQMLVETLASLKQNTDEFKQLAPALDLMSAQIALSQRNFASAEALASSLDQLSAKDYPEVAIESKIAVGLSNALGGNTKQGTALCDEAAKMANDAGETVLQFRAMLAQAEASLLAGDAGRALTFALQAQESFARGSQLESQWRAYLIAARANERLGDVAKAAEQRQAAKNVLRDLEKQ